MPTLLSKHGAESTNPTAATKAQVCIQRHDHTFSYHKLPKQIDHGDDVNQKTSPNLMRDPIQEVDIQVGHNKRCYQHHNTTHI